MQLFSSKAASAHWHCTLDVIIDPGIVLLALSLASWMLLDHFRASDALWRDFYHDRHGYYDYGLGLALDLRNLDFFAFLKDLERAHYWGPLHGLIMSIFLLIGGIDHRLAIAPAVLGWATTIVFCWLITRRMFQDRIASTVGAAVAACFAVSSPVFRMLGSDVMIETLGAAMTALAIWLFMRACDAPGRLERWRALALALTALFFCKANYWVLTGTGLILAYEFQHAREIRTILRRLDAGGMARFLATDPMVLTFAVLVTAILAIIVYGPASIEISGYSIKLSPGNPLTIAYAILFCRIVLLWKRHREAIHELIGGPGQMLMYWHIVPIAISFLLPKRLATFIFYVGPLNTTEGFNPWNGILTYWAALEAWQSATWIVVLMLALAALAFSQFRRVPPPGRAVFFVLLVSAAAVVIHPQHQPRYMGSWLFTLWICAGTGAGLLSSWLQGIGQRARIGISAAGVTAIFVLLIRAPVPASAYAAAFRANTGPSDLVIAAAYLPFTTGFKEIGFASTFGKSWLLFWTTREYCRCKASISFLEQAPASRQEARSFATEWLNTTTATRIVLVDVEKLGPRYELPPLWTRDRMVGIVDAFADQNRFKLIAIEHVPAHGATVSIWDRK